MKKALMTLLLGGLAAAAFAATPTTPPVNTLVLGAHVIRSDDAAPGTRVDINLAGPTDVAGAQFKLLYDPKVVTVVDPVGTDFESTEGEGSVIKSPSVVVNYGADGDSANPGLKGIFVAIAASKGATKTGTAAHIWFKAAAGAKAGDSSKFILSADKADFVLSKSDATQIADAGVSTGSLVIGGTKANSGSAVFPVGIGGSVSVGPSPDGKTTAAYVVDNLGQLQTLDPTGTTASPSAIPASGMGSMGRPTINAGFVAYGTADGKVVIAQQSGTGVQTATASAAVNSAPAILNGNVYVSTADGKFQAFNASTGAAVGTTQTIGGSGMSSPSAMTGVNTPVWVGGGTGVFEFNGADLSPMKTITTGSEVKSSPSIMGLFGVVGADDGKVYGMNAGTGDAIGSFDTTAPVRNAPFILPSALLPGITGIGAVTVNTQGQVSLVMVDAAAVTGTNPAVKFAAGSDSAQSPIVVGSTLYVGDTAGMLHTATITGPAAATVGKDIVISSKPVTSVASMNGMIYAAAQDGSVISIPAF